MTSISEAIRVTTDLEVQWYELGRNFGEEGSIQQAEFLLGFHDTVPDQQLAFIGDEKILDGQRGELADILIHLALRISPDRASEVER